LWTEVPAAAVSPGCDRMLADAFNHGGPIMRNFGLIIFFSLGLAPFAASADEHDIAGRAEMVRKNVTYELARGHTVIMAMSEQTFRADAASGPLHGAAGACFGEVELKGRSASGDGYCKWADPAGRSILMAWDVSGTDEAGMMFGRWLLIGGEGKWASASGTGTWQHARKGETLTNRVTGTIALK